MAEAAGAAAAGGKEIVEMVIYFPNALIKFFMGSKWA
jgi:hypothetical protein